jgi:hypothetical protein
MLNYEPTSGEGYKKDFLRAIGARKTPCPDVERWEKPNAARKPRTDGQYPFSR